MFEDGKGPRLHVLDSRGDHMKKLAGLAAEQIKEKQNEVAQVTATSASLGLQDAAKQRQRQEALKAARQKLTLKGPKQRPGDWAVPSSQTQLALQNI